jgi:hypothetical protein
VFDELVVLDSNVDVGKLLVVSAVEVSQLDPFVHQPQRNLVAIFLVLGYLFVVVDPSSFVHELPVVLLAPLNDINDGQHNETQIEDPN